MDWLINCEDFDSEEVGEIARLVNEIWEGYPKYFDPCLIDTIGAAERIESGRFWLMQKARACFIDKVRFNRFRDMQTRFPDDTM
jgi:hypothetical protein